MKRFIRCLVAVVTCLIGSASAAQTGNALQDLEAVRSKAEAFLKTQAAAMPGNITVRAQRLDPRTKMAACDKLEPFMLPGRRAWGKTSVGIRCHAPSKWTLYVKARVSVMGEYVAAALPLAQGHLITPVDLVTLKGDLTSLPPGTLTNPSEAVGKKISMSIPLGSAIRKELLRNQLAIQSGQMVRLVSHGSGFKVTAEGRALSSANEGQLVQTRTPSGQTISGIARLGGVVEVGF